MSQILIDFMVEELARVVKERDEALDEVERLRVELTLAQDQVGADR